jgi:nitrite reductase (NO-forming)
VELIGQVPSTLVLVDHALSRTFDKGAIGLINIVGDPNPEIFEGFDAVKTEGEAVAPPAETTDTDAAAGGEEVTVVMLPNSWTPQPMDAADEFAEVEDPADYSTNVLTVKAGTTVTWVNEDAGQIHTATAVDGSFDSGFLAEGQTWSMTFDTPGEFEYFCVPHPWMRAKIIVES